MKPDATWLFEGKDTLNGEKVRVSMNSESWWTALFSIFVIESCALHETIELPLKRYCREKDLLDAECFESFDKKVITFSNLTYDNVYIETSASKMLEHITQFKNIKPDVVIKDDMKINIIENKTVQAHDDSLDKYSDLCDILNGNGYSAKLYLLASRGLSQDSVWSVVNERKLPVILWEDVFKKMDEYGYSSKIFGRQLDRYY